MRTITESLLGPQETRFYLQLYPNKAGISVLWTLPMLLIVKLEASKNISRGDQVKLTITLTRQRKIRTSIASDRQRIENDVRPFRFQTFSCK